MRPLALNENVMEVGANRLNLLRWLPLIVIGGALLIIWRRVFAQPAVVPIVPIPQPAIPLAPTQAQPVRPGILVRLLRWLLFILIALGLAWVMVSIPRPYSIIALGLVVVIVLQWPRALTVSAIALMIASALTFRDAVHFYELEGPTILMMLGVVALWATIQLDWRLRRIPAMPIPATPTWLTGRWSETHISLFLLGLIALVELMRINSFRFDRATNISDSIDVQHLLLVTAVTLIVIGLGRLDFARRLPRLNWRVVLPVVGLMALAFVVRFWQIYNTPRFYIDELFFSNYVHYFWYWRYAPLIAPFDSVAAEPLLFPYWQSITVELFGRNFAGLRGASAIIGTLTVGVTYLLGRTLFDRKTALLGALLLATFPPHIHFSRIGLSEIAMAFFGATSFAFFARGLTSDRRFDYVMGGAMLGMTHYFHEGGKYLFTPLTVLWLAGVWLACRPRVSIRNLLFAALACGLVALPIYSTLLLTQQPLAARMVTNSAGLDGAYWRQLFDSRDFYQHILQHLSPPFLLYVQRPDNTLFYAGGNPMMLSFVVPAFLLGFFYSIRRWNQPGPMLLVLWVISTSLGNSLLVESGNVARFVVVTPALMLLVAVGIRYTLPLLWPEQETRVEQVVPIYRRIWTPAYLQLALMGVLVVGMSAAQVDYYYNHHLPTYNQQFRDNWGHRDALDAVLRSVDFPPGTQLHIISPAKIPDLDFTRGFMNFMVDGLRVITLSSNEFTLKYISLQKMVRDHAFYIDPTDRATIALIHEHFDVLPGSMSPFDLPRYYQFMLYYAPAQNPVDNP
jgi:hypothetical protein